MRSLEAISLDPDLRNLPPDELVIVGSMTIGLLKEKAGIEKGDNFVKIDDLDGCVSPTTYRQLRVKSKYPQDTEPGDTCWIRASYTGIETLRRSHRVEGLDWPVQLDIGTTVGHWSHKEVAADAVEHEGHNVLNPLRQLAWYEMLGRKKDEEKIAKLRIIIPRLWETVAISVPAELRELASDVLKPRE